MTEAGRCHAKAALLTPTYWPEVRRGTERVVHDLAVGLASRGEGPRIITSHPECSTRTMEDGVEVVRNWRPPDAPLRARRIQEHLTHVPGSYASLRRGDDALAHAFYPTDALAATRWARETGRPSVFAYMGIPQRNVLSTRRGRLRILERATTETSAVTVLSRTARDAMWRWLGVEGRVIHPGVDLRRFAPGAPRDPVPTIVSAAAPDDARKRMDLLLAAFGRVRRERPEVRLLLERPADRALAARFERDVDGLAFFDRDTPIESLFGRAWVSALTSYNEAFGLVLVEAMACGIPAVGPADGGPAEIIDGPAVGRTFADDDPRTVAVALVEALELSADPGTAAATRARAEDFGVDRFVERHLELYRELLSRG